MTFGSIALIAAAGVGGYVIFKPASAQTTPTVATSSLSQSSTQSSSDTSSATLGSSSTASTTTNSSASYKDGTYTSSTSYQVPHGNTNSIKVTVVVSGGKITSVKTDDSYSDGESERYVSAFESSVSSDANGQSLASYSPSRIGGASLTTEAFANTIETIRSQAVG